MLMMATRAVVRKRFNSQEEKKKATGNTTVTIPDDLKARIKEIVKEIFKKVDTDGVSTGGGPPVRLCFFLFFQFSNAHLFDIFLFLSFFLCRVVLFRCKNSKRAFLIIPTSVPSSNNSEELATHTHTRVSLSVCE